MVEQMEWVFPAEGLIQENDLVVSNHGAWGVNPEP